MLNGMNFMYCIGKVETVYLYVLQFLEKNNLKYDELGMEKVVRKITGTSCYSFDSTPSSLMAKGLIQEDCRLTKWGKMAISFLQFHWRDIFRMLRHDHDFIKQHFQKKNGFWSWLKRLRNEKT